MMVRVNNNFIPLLITLYLLMGCEKPKTTITNTEYNAKIPKDTAAILSTCPCGKRPCQFTIYSTFCHCSKIILNNQESRNFVINWASNCCGGGNYAPSFGKVCYTGDKDELYVEISNNVPLCLVPCYGEVACFRANIIKCHGDSFYIGWNDGTGNNTMELTNEDIVIRLKCKQNNTIYECSGTVVWQ